jgi:hypothetical protein
MQAMRSVDIADEFLQLYNKLYNPKTKIASGDGIERLAVLENELNSRGFEVILPEDNDEGIVKIQQSFNEEPNWCPLCKETLDDIRFEETLTAKWETDKGYIATRRTCKAICTKCGTVVGEVDTDPEKGYQKGLEISYSPQEE